MYISNNNQFSIKYRIIEYEGTWRFTIINHTKRKATLIKPRRNFQTSWRKFPSLDVAEHATLLDDSIFYFWGFVSLLSYFLSQGSLDSSTQMKAYCIKRVWILEKLWFVVWHEKLRNSVKSVIQLLFSLPFNIRLPFRVLAVILLAFLSLWQTFSSTVNLLCCCYYYYC